MTNEEILKKAIDEANKNGFSDINPEEWAKFLDHRGYFMHDFAKVFWGEDKLEIEGQDVNGEDIVVYKKTGWKYHLQQMVLEENPLKYLEKFLDDSH